MIFSRTLWRHEESHAKEPLWIRTATFRPSLPRSPFPPAVAEEEEDTTGKTVRNKKSLKNGHSSYDVNTFMVIFIIYIIYSFTLGYLLYHHGAYSSPYLLTAPSLLPTFELELFFRVTVQINRKRRGAVFFG